MDASPQHLFVYGTLLSGAANLMAEYLEGKGQWLGPATMPGKLYAVNFFPGAIYEPGAETLIQGEVMQLSGSPGQTFRVLDEYEGYQPQQPETSLFVRKAVEVIRQNGQTLSCWCYLYNRPVARLPRIESGNYLRHLAEFTGE
jgi:gamma-glutamylcyclotransferase (GGCT)/AIG2-like uncharacterized protein YtfP